VFHTATWLSTVAGVGAFLRAVVRGGAVTPRVVAGSGLLGFGVFNLLEGVVNHHIFGVHGAVAALGVPDYDWAFLLSGALLSVGGVLLLRHAHAPLAFRNGTATDERQPPAPAVDPWDAPTSPPTAHVTGR
jgi:uncharacterized membrane protein